MRNLTVEEMNVVAGGTETSETVADNARTAEDICGEDNVKSVSKDGFVCKD